MSEQKGYYAPPAAGYGLYLLLRMVWEAIGGSKPSRPAHSPAREQRPADAATPKPIITPPPKPQPVTPPPIVPWQSERELLAWRAWGLCHWPGDPRPALHSIGVPWAWNGPVLRADFAPYGSPENHSGIHALKIPLYGHVPWIWTESCWVTGWVALSGRVVEHEFGYRAERAVIRKLRLGVGTHLVEQRIPVLQRIARELEDRYQAPVKIGWTERRLARVLLGRGFRPQLDRVGFASPANGWRLG